MSSKRGHPAWRLDMLLTHLHCRSILLHYFYIMEVTLGQI